MSRHEHIHRAGIVEGEPFDFVSKQVTSQGIVEQPISEPVEHITGNGFFGSVIVLPDSVIKTTTPDALHEALRVLNWDIPFPSRAFESAAQLDYLAGRILHQAVPIFTDGQVHTPQAHGYVRVSRELGYGQHAERTYGRGTIFNDGGKENAKIRQARQELWGLVTTLGSEHVAQVHPNNPFGKPNLWLAQDGSIIWHDYLPAFRHTAHVRPILNFGFHDDVRKTFGSLGPTYNRIHTSMLRKSLEERSNRISFEDFDGLTEAMELYDDASKRYQDAISGDPRNLYIQDAQERGLISPQQAEHLRRSPRAFEIFRTKEVARLGVQAFLDFCGDSKLKLLRSPEFHERVSKLATDRSHLSKALVNNSILLGMKQAHAQGLVSTEQLEQALEKVSNKDMAVYLGMSTYYMVVARAVDVMTVPMGVAAATSENPARNIGLVSIFNIFAPGILRAVSTAVVDTMSETDLKRAARTTLIPMYGTYAAIPEQIYVTYGQKAGEILHYSVRAVVAAVSKIVGGGWGSDAEERLWNATVGRKVNRG